MVKNLFLELKQKPNDSEHKLGDKNTRIKVFHLSEHEINHVKTLPEDNFWKRGTKIIHLTDSLIAIITEKQIRIVDMIDFIPVKTIDIGDEKIRTACPYKNGFATVNYYSEIKVYDFV